MSGIDPLLPAPDDRFETVNDGLSASPPPAYPPLPAMPARTVARPFPLHPNFWWAILWCIGILLFTQIPGALVSVVILLGVALLSPSVLKVEQLNGGATLLDHPVGQISILAAILVAHALMVIFSLLVLRIVVGRDWRRQVAVRLPRFSQFVMVLAVGPAFIVLGIGVDQFIDKVVHVPSIGSDIPGVVAFWIVVTGDLLALGIATLFSYLIGMQSRISLARQIIVALIVVIIAAGPNRWAYATLREYFQATFLGSVKGGGIQQMELLFARWPLALAVFVIGVMPALSEELWCRAFLGRGLLGKHGLVWGVLGTSFLFGALHGDPRQGTVAMLMGITLHYVYLTTRSLLMPMLLHFLNNSLAVSLSRIPALNDLDKVQDNQVYVLASVCTGAAVLLAAVCWALYQSRARLVSDGSGPAWQPPYPGVFCPPPGSGTRIETPGLSGVSLALVAAGLTAFVAGFVMTIQAIQRLG